MLINHHTKTGLQLIKAYVTLKNFSIATSLQIPNVVMSLRDEWLNLRAIATYYLKKYTLKVDMVRFRWNICMLCTVIGTCFSSEGTTNTLWNFLYLFGNWKFLLYTSETFYRVGHSLIALFLFHLNQKCLTGMPGNHLRNFFRFGWIALMGMR